MYLLNRLINIIIYVGKTIKNCRVYTQIKILLLFSEKDCFSCIIYLYNLFKKDGKRWED